MKKPATLPDTNVVLRYLLRDVEAQFAEADAFFEKVRSGRAQAQLLESVLVECIYILSKHYKVPRSEISANLANLLVYKGIDQSDRQILIQALAVFGETNLDPVDCVLAARVSVAGQPLMTFDKALQRQCKKLQTPH